VTWERVIGGYWLLLMVIILVGISDYFINGYCWLFYWWLFYYKILLDILSYVIMSYCWLFYLRSLYFILNYFKFLYLE